MTFQTTIFKQNKHRKEHFLSIFAHLLLLFRYVPIYGLMYSMKTRIWMLQHIGLMTHGISNNGSLHLGFNKTHTTDNIHRLICGIFQEYGMMFKIFQFLLIIPLLIQLRSGL